MESNTGSMQVTRSSKYRTEMAVRLPYRFSLLIFKDRSEISFVNVSFSFVLVMPLTLNGRKSSGVRLSNKDIAQLCLGV